MGVINNILSNNACICHVPLSVKLSFNPIDNIKIKKKIVKTAQYAASVIAIEANSNGNLSNSIKLILGGSSSALYSN